MITASQRMIASAQQSQVIVEKSIDDFIDPGDVLAQWNFDLRNIRIHPRLGQSQFISIDLGFFGEVAQTNVPGVLEIVLYDKAFEDINVFGQAKTREDKAKDRRAAQGEF